MTTANLDTTTELPVDPNAPPAAAPAPANDQQPAAPTSQTVMVDGEEHTIPTDLSTVLDPDVRAGYQAMLDASKEAPLTTGEPAATPSPAAVPAADVDPKASSQPVKPTTMVPVTALQAERERTRQAEANANYFKGLAEGRTPAAPGTTPATAAAPEPTPEAKIGDLNRQIDALAAQFDNGEITMAQYKAQERLLESQVTDIREQALLAKLPANKATSSANDLYLEEKSEAIEQQHPYATLLFPLDLPTDPDERDSLLTHQEMVRAEAIAQMQRKHKGLVLDDDNPRSVFILRETMAKLADQYGPVWFPNAQVAPAASALPGKQPAAAAQPSANAQNRLSKIVLAAQQPPDTASLGTTGTVTGELTEEAVMKMTEDQLAKLTPAQLAKFGVM